MSETGDTGAETREPAVSEDGAAAPESSSQGVLEAAAVEVAEHDGHGAASSSPPGDEIEIDNAPTTPGHKVEGPPAQEELQMLEVDLLDLPPLPEASEASEPFERTTHTPPPVSKTQEQIDYWTGIIERYEREARALGDGPGAAQLFLEIGRIWEEQVGKQRKAATYYQRAFQLAKTDTTILHAARRLFTEVDNPRMMAQILRAEIEASDNAEERARLMAEKAIVVEERLEDPERAQQTYRDALEVWAAEPLALYALEHLHLARAEYRALYGVYQRAIAVAQSSAQRCEFSVAAAQLAEDHLDDTEGAIRHYEAVLQIDEDNALALAALRRLYGSVGRWEGLVEILVKSASVADSPRKATNHLVSAAKVEADRLGAMDRSLTLMLRALEHSPDDIVLLRDIEWLYDAHGLVEDVAKVLQREVTVVSEPVNRVPVLVRLGTVLEQKLDRGDEALPIFQEAVGLMPDYLPARQALGRLFRRTERFEELAALYTRELEGPSPLDGARKVTVLLKLAELHADHLDRADTAIEALEKLLALQPDCRPAIELLQRLFAEGGHHEKLIRLHEKELELTTDEAQKYALLIRMARMWERDVGNLEEAASARRRALELTPNHLENIRALGRNATAREDYREVLRALELELEASGDQSEVVAILYRTGVIHETCLEALDDAIASYEKVLNLAPTHLPCLQRLGRLYQRQERYEDLLSMHRLELDSTDSDAHAIDLLFRMGGILVDQLLDDTRAVGIYEEILRRRPDSLAAFDVLCQLFVREGDHDKLERLLSSQAESCDDPQRTAQLLQSVAELCEHELDRPDRAAEILQQLLRLGIEREMAVESLIRIFSVAGLWNPLSLALRSAVEVTTEPKAKAAILVRCAEIYGDRLGKWGQSADLLEEALALSREDASILRQLERVHVIQRDWNAVIDVSRRICATEEDRTTKVARQVYIASLKENRVAPPTSGVAHYVEALSLIPNHRAALRGAELGFRRSMNWSALLALYRREAMTCPDPRRRGNFLFRAGDLAEHRLEDEAVAEECYRLTLNILPTHLPSITGLRRVAQRRGDSATVLEMLKAERAAVFNPERTLQLLYEEGVLHKDTLDAPESASVCFAMILEQDPAHFDASMHLEQIYRGADNWSGLLDLLNARASVTTGAEPQADIYLAAAHVAQDKLQDVDLAIGAFREVLKRRSNDTTALTRLGPLLVTNEQYDDAIEIFRHIVRVSNESSTLSSAHRALGILYEEHKDDLIKAVRAYQSAFQAEPTDVESLVRLANVYQSEADWKSAVNVLLRLVDVHPDLEDKVRTLIELGHIYQSKLKDEENASRAFLKARELAPTSLAANLGLIELYEQIENWNSLTEVAEMYLRAIPAEQRQDSVALHVKLATVFEMKLEDDERASRELRSALSVQPNNVEALEILSRLYGKQRGTYPQAIEIHRRLLKIDPFRVESYHQMRMMFEQRQEFDKAFVLCEILVFLRSQKPEEDLYFNEHRDKVAPHSSGVLSTEEHKRWLIHPDEQGPARGILEVLRSELWREYPYGGDLKAYDVSARSDRHGARSDLPLRRLADELGGVIGMPDFDIWITKKHDTELFVENVERPALVVGHGFDRRKREAEKRFLIGRELERIKGGHFLIDNLPDDEVRRLIFGAAKVANPGLTLREDPEGVDAVRRKIEKAMSRRARRSLDELAMQVARLRLEPARYKAATRHTANRVGLALTNDVQAVIRTIARQSGKKAAFADIEGARESFGDSDEIGALLNFAVSEGYFAIRAKLGFSIQS